jgi:hypothetical protein
MPPLRLAAGVCALLVALALPPPTAAFHDCPSADNLSLLVAQGTVTSASPAMSHWYYAPFAPSVAVLVSGVGPGLPVTGANADLYVWSVCPEFGGFVVCSSTLATPVDNCPVLALFNHIEVRYAASPTGSVPYTLLF